tara:strand:+ start:431 stop:916 length:486 start_codon:yes stop_codon:yes gene_type:complete
MAGLLDGNWGVVTQFDPRLVGLYLRHYSAKKALGGTPDYYKRVSRYRNGVVGPGENLCLLTVDGQAGWIWRREMMPRKDNQVGVNCSLFRNEGPLLSSDLVAEADDLARGRWPDVARHWTYVADSKIKSGNPGYCYKMAGWRACGRNKDGTLTVLEKTWPD